MWPCNEPERIEVTPIPSPARQGNDSPISVPVNWHSPRFLLHFKANIYQETEMEIKTVHFEADYTAAARAVQMSPQKGPRLAERRYR